MLNSQIYHLADILGLPVYRETATGNLKARHKVRLEAMPGLLLVMELDYATTLSNGELVAIYTAGVSWDSDFRLLFVIPKNLDGSSIFFLNGKKMERAPTSKDAKKWAGSLSDYRVADFVQDSRNSPFEQVT